jgi:hypothetical protein
MTRDGFEKLRIDKVMVPHWVRRYFLVHHTPADTVDKIAPEDLGRLVAAVASMAYVVADIPEPLPRK